MICVSFDFNPYDNFLWLLTTSLISAPLRGQSDHPAVVTHLQQSFSSTNGELWVSSGQLLKTYSVILLSFTIFSLSLFELNLGFVNIWHHVYFWEYVHFTLYHYTVGFNHKGLFIMSSRRRSKIRYYTLLVNPL
jgi:hypothetical protein